MPEILKASGSSNPRALAGAIAAVLRREGSVEVRAVGASAVNQAVKAIIIARQYTVPYGIQPVMIPAFTTTEIDGSRRKAIGILVRSDDSRRA